MLRRATFVKHRSCVQVCHPGATQKVRLTDRERGHCVRELICYPYSPIHDPVNSTLQLRFSRSVVNTKSLTPSWLSATNSRQSPSDRHPNPRINCKTLPASQFEFTYLTHSLHSPSLTHSKITAVFRKRREEHSGNHSPHLSPHLWAARGEDSLVIHGNSASLSHATQSFTHFRLLS